MLSLLTIDKALFMNVNTPAVGQAIVLTTWHHDSETLPLQQEMTLLEVFDLIKVGKIRGLSTRLLWSWILLSLLLWLSYGRSQWVRCFEIEHNWNMLLVLLSAVRGGFCVNCRRFNSYTCTITTKKNYRVLIFKRFGIWNFPRA